MTAPRTPASITIAGPPGKMAVVVPLDASGDTVVPISVSVGGRPTIYRAVVKPFGSDQSEIRLRLPADTPPGTYTGEGTIGGKPRGVVVEVEPVMKVRTQPRQTVLAVAPSARVDFRVTVQNAGNVAIDIPKVDTFDLDDGEGQDRALGRALRASGTDGTRGVDRFFDELRQSHGGEARVLLKDGAGRLAPGETRPLACVLEVPATVQEGRTYVGAWTLGNGAHVIVCEITTNGRLRNGRPKP